MDDRKQLIYLVSISTLFRLIVSNSVELGNVEAYYWTFASHLQWNYFDHPPAVAWLIRLTTVNLLFHQALFVRLGAVISAAICTCLIFKIGLLTGSRRTGWIVALLYTSCLYSSYLIGVFVLPDSPQMIFWLLSILFLLRIVKQSGDRAASSPLWIYFGISAGLCIMCKVHGIFLWIGIFLFIILYRQSWLKNKCVYIAAGISLVISTPIWIWNFQNGFATLLFHGHRIFPTASGIDVPGFFKNVFDLFLVVNPLNFILICRSLYGLRKRGKIYSEDSIRLILCCCLPLICLLFCISLSRQTYPHWYGPAFTLLLIFPAIWLTSDPENTSAKIPGPVKWAFVFSLMVILAQVLIANYYPGTVSGGNEEITMGKDDTSLDMYGWKKMAGQFDSVFRRDQLDRVMQTGAPIIVTKWNSASHIDFYFCHITGQETIGMGEVNGLHEYYWTNRFKKPLSKGDSAYYVIPSDEFDYKEFDFVVQHFKTYHFLPGLPQYRNGVMCRELYIFKMFGYTD